MKKIVANDIIRLLGARADSNQHVFFNEVTDYGRTYKGRQSRIDAIAIKPAYSKLQVWGYEVKVSRGDFLQDEKWHAYLEMCNSLYFVCPHGVIGKDEVPEQCGLMYVTKNGRILRTVKKAPYRPVKFRPEFFMGMIFNKCGLHTCETREQRVERALKYRAASEGALELGQSLGSGLAAELKRSKKKQSQLDDRLAELKDVQDYLEEQGVNLQDSWSRHSCSHQTLKDRLIHRRGTALANAGMGLLIADAERTMRNMGVFTNRLKIEQAIITQEETNDDHAESPTLDD